MTKLQSRYIIFYKLYQFNLGQFSSRHNVAELPVQELHTKVICGSKVSQNYEESLLLATK